MSTDPITQLSPPPLDDDRLEALWARTWRAVEAEEAPRRPVRHRRRLVVAGAALVALGTGGGVAVAASGHDRVVGFLGGLVSSGPPSTAGTPDPESAEIVFSVPGPEGLEMQGWTIASEEGGLCTSVLFEPAGQVDPAPNEVDPIGGGGGYCSVGHTEHGLFENLNVTTQPGPVALDLVGEAGDAARAELRTGDGRVYPVTVADGWLGGWWSPEQVSGPAVVVAYAADGSVLGRHRVG